MKLLHVTFDQDRTMDIIGGTEVPDLSNHEDVPIEESQSDDDQNVCKEHST